MARTPIKITSALTIETRHGVFKGKRWMALLEAIGNTPSITAAARSVGLSYKAAWDAVEAMNNLSEQPLVERSVGGKGGGGARLTARGAQLVATFRAVEHENSQFIERVNSRIAGTGAGAGIDADADLKIIARLNMQTSARNHFAGKIVRIQTGAVNDEVELALSGGDRIVAILTHHSVEQMDLKVGADAIALVKASSVLIAVGGGAAIKLSARNQLDGRISRIVPGAVNTEVVIALSGGNSVAAIITQGSAKALQLVEGLGARAIFKASSVILATVA